MKKIITTILLSMMLFGIQFINAQTYSGKGYANGTAGVKYTMPGTEITSETEVELNTIGVVTGYWFDIANSEGPDLNRDQNITFGISSGSGTDAGGGDKRGYITNASTSYTPIRWNGGSQMFRNSGQWVRFTIDFQDDIYNFVYRGNIQSYAVPSHKFELKIFKPNSMSSPVYSRVIDLTSSFPVEGAMGDNILRIGGGNADTDWFKMLDPIDLAAGTYVVELSSHYQTFTHQPWGAFTFNSAKTYDGVPYKNTAWVAGKDTVKAWEYDKVGLGTNYSSEYNVTFGAYGINTTTEGDNIRSYTADPSKGAVRWNSATKTFQTNGGWYNYTTKFEGKASYFFKFRGLPLMGDPVWGGTIKILEPLTKLEIQNLTIDNDIQYVSNDDVGEATRWMYIKTPVEIPEGTFLVKIDFPIVGDQGIMGEFCFSKEHPTSSVPQLITYNWPATIPHSDKYTVKVTQDGFEKEMFEHLTVPDTRPSLYPDDNGGFGIPTFMTDRTLTYTQFAYTNEILVEVTKNFGSEATRVEIQPKAYGINPIYFDGRTVRFYLKHQTNKPSYISVNFVSDDNIDAQGYNHNVPKHGMMLFGDKLEVSVPDKTAPGTVVYNESVTAAEVEAADVIYFPAGDYNLKDKFDRGVIELTKDGQRIYAEGGAYIRGTIWSQGFNDIWLYGRGIITGADYIFHELLDENGVKEAYLNFNGSDGCHFEGLTITDPCHHTIPSGSNSYFKNMKIMGWSYNADGTRVGGSSYIEEMFYRTMDDYDYGDRQHLFKNSVIWPMRNGAFSMLGWGSYDGGKATYENLYFINSEWDRPEVSVGNQGVLGSKNKQGSNIANDTLRNLYLEDYTTILTVLRHTYDETFDFDANDPGEFKEFLFENIKVEHPFLKSTGEQAWQRIEGYEHNGVRSSVHDITFRNLVVAGELVTTKNKDKYFKINADYAYNIFFEIVGDVHTIRATSGVGGNIFPGGDIAVPHGTSQYVSIQPEVGYRIKDVKIDYQSVGRLQTIHLDDVTSDHVIEVEFEPGANVFDLTDVPDVKSVLADDIDLAVDWDTSIKGLFGGSRNMLTVYPNPASSFIYVKGVADGEVIKIYDSVGQLLLTSLTANINVQSLKKGIYLINVNDRFAKFIVK